MENLYQNKNFEEEDTMKDLYLIFKIKDRDYGIEIRHLIEIVALQKITLIDNMPPYIKGVINLRGKIIPVLDVRLRLNLEPIEYHDRTCIVIVTVHNLQAGLIVDSVSEVLKIIPENIEAAPSFGDYDENKFIESIGKVGESLKIILNLPRFILGAELKRQ